MYQNKVPPKQTSLGNSCIIVFCVVAVAEEETAGNLQFIDAFFFTLSPDTVFIILNQIGWGPIDLSRVQNYRFVNYN